MFQSLRVPKVPGVSTTKTLHQAAFGLGLAVAMLGFGSVSHAGAVLPSGGSVMAGSAVISKAGPSTLQITQTSTDAIIDWSSFSIGHAGVVQIDNGGGATLNRVTGAGISSLQGLLNATGSVYLINPSGVIIGKSGVVNVGGTFVASTLDIADAAFLAGGNLTFSGSSTSHVVNLGSIGALGGDVVLIANSVVNRGTLSAPNGDVGLLSGTTVLLQDAATDDGKFIVQVGAAGGDVVNSGGISAAMAELRANGGNVYALAGNTTGVINATGVSSLDGQVFLVADGGEVTAKGSISAVHADGSGGEVETVGTSVNVVGLSVTAGSWLVGADSLTATPAMASTLSRDLATTSIVLQTTGATTPGDLTLDGRIAWTGANTLTLDAANDITVNKAMSLLGGGLNLSAPDGSITIDAPIKVKGAGAVSLAASETDGILNLGFGLTDAGFGGSLSFQRHDQKHQSLTINGQAYTLLYSYDDGSSSGKRDLAGIDKAGDGGDYALADNVRGMRTVSLRSKASSLACLMVYLRDWVTK